MSNVVRSIKKKTAWNRRSRVNNDNMLAIKGSVAGGLKHKVEITTDQRFNFGTGDFAISFFGLAESSSNQDFFEIRGSSGHKVWWNINGSSIRLLNTCSGGGYTLSSTSDSVNTNHALVNKINHYVFQRNGLNRDLYCNKILVARQVGLSTDSYDFSGGDFVIGNALSRTDIGLNCRVSHFAFFNKALTEAERDYIHRWGGVIPPTVHRNCVAYYPLNHRYGDIAYDAVEQFNYAKWNSTSVSLYTDAAWFENNGFAIDNANEATFISDGVNNGTLINNNGLPGASGIYTTQSFWTEFTFDILEAFDGDGVNFQVTTYDTSEVSANYTDVGTYTVKLLIRNIHNGLRGGRFQVSAAANNTGGKISNMRDVKVYDIWEANHGALVNFDWPWYANHAFTAAGYGEAQYSTMDTNLPDSGIVTFNSDHVEYEATVSSSDIGLKVVSLLTLKAGKIYQVEVDWEFINPSEIGNAILTLGGTGGLTAKGDTFARVQETFEITYISGSTFYIALSNVGIGDILKIYSVKIWEKGKEPGVDSKPTGVPVPASNTAWQSFYDKNSLTSGLCFNKRDQYILDASAYSFVSNPENLGDATTGILPSNSSYNLTFVGVFLGATTGSFSGGGQVIFSFSTTGAVFALRSADVFRLTMSGGVLVDFTIPYLFNNPLTHCRPFIVNVRYNNATGDVHMAFRFLDSKSVIKQTFLAAGTWSRSSNVPVVVGGGSSLGLMAIKVQSSFVSETVENEIMAGNFNSLTPVIDWNFKGLISPTAYDNIGNLTPVLYRSSIPTGYLDQTAFDAWEKPNVGSKTGLPEIKSALNVSSGQTFSNDAFGDLIGTGKLTMCITVQFPSATIPMPPGGQRFFELSNYCYAHFNASGILRFNMSSPVVLAGQGSTPVHMLTIFGYREIGVADYGKSGLNGISEQQTPSQNTAIDISGTHLRIYGMGVDYKIIRVGVWNRKLSIKEQLALSSNTRLSNPDIKMQEGIKGYYIANEEAFYVDGTDVKMRDLSVNGRDLIITGFAGATPEDQLLTLKSAITSV